MKNHTSHENYKKTTKSVKKRIASIRMSNAKWNILEKSPYLWYIDKRMRRWEWNVMIANYLLIKDEYIIEHYKWKKNALKNICWLLETYRLRNWWKKIPTYWTEEYSEYIGEINELENIENLLFFLKKRIDMYHELELKTWVPIKDNLKTIKLFLSSLVVLHHLRKSLWITSRFKEVNY